ncbi:hypothetical protein [Janibacter cremeus]|uniref:Uncharacterized protein n=1 Tax=Janibacter cremeus TaxID=1285192 RepID=A0A852VM37_9MICO|nr:hypothetical protein [Janibacter cremeus]NYF98092.1 hypothetical protein [Janibacter cremeus]
MPVEMRSFVRSTMSAVEREEVERVTVLAEQLRSHMQDREQAINQAHVVGAQSSAIQAIVSEVLKDELGFGEEVVLTPQDGIVTRARPDFVFSLGQGRGVMAEVERGGTVNNNHDLKDMWKAHIATDIQHLFLIVPNSNWTRLGAPREKPFPRVCNRIGAFFGNQRRGVDVLTTHVYGYGLLDIKAAVELRRGEGS